jgi:leader peptidase (prepilin peptidase) / N-methyltransferase
MSSDVMIHGALIAFLGVIAAVICWVDFRKMIIPDWTNGLPAVTGFLVSVFLFKQSWHVVLGAAVVTGFLFTALAATYRRLRAVSGLGMGDIKFIAAASTWVGWGGLPWRVLLACIGGLAHVIVRHLAGHDMHAMTRIPFGPYLSVGLITVWSLGLSI